MTKTTVGYLQGPSGPLYRHVSGTTDVSWYVYDGLGSVVGEVDVTGNLTASKSHDVYGLTRSVTGNPTSRHGFVGGLGHTEDDETGFVYMRARHYDPETGRFASEDPAYDGSNWFVYANNCPTSCVDLSGQSAILGSSAVSFLKWLFNLSSADEAILNGNNVAKQIDLLRKFIGALKHTQGNAEAMEEALNAEYAQALGRDDETGMSRASCGLVNCMTAKLQCAFGQASMQAMILLLEGSDSGFISIENGQVSLTPFL